VNRVRILRRAKLAEDPATASRSDRDGIMKPTILSPSGNDSAVHSMAETRVRLQALGRALMYVLKRGVGVRYVPLARAAVRSYTLCGPGEVEAVNPFVWDDHLPRIRAAARFTAEHTINEFLRRKKFSFIPVVAHWLEDAALLDGSVYSRGCRHEVRPWGNRSRIGFKLSGPAAEIEQAALAANSFGSTWWGHWLEDEVPLQLVVERFAPIIAHDRSLYRDELTYRAMLRTPDPARFGAAIVRQLLVLEDHGQNPDKTRRYHVLRDRARVGPAGHDRVFLSRGASGARRLLVNEAEVRRKLESDGFVTVPVDSASAEEIIAACRGASVVVSVEGSHLAPLLYLMRDFGAMVILNPPFQVQTTVATVALFCGIAPGMFVCEPHGDSKTDFVADVEEVSRFIDDVVLFSRESRSRLEAFLESTLRTGTSASIGLVGASV
jgi:hypothetical protein